MRKFPGQRSNMCYNSNLSHSSDSAGFSSHAATKPPLGFCKKLLTAPLLPPLKPICLTLARMITSLLWSKAPSSSSLTQSQSQRPYQGPQALGIRPSVPSDITSSSPSLAHLQPPCCSSITSGLLCLGAFFFFFLGPHLWHMEVSRLGVESELQLLAYAPATATPDPSCVCNLHHSSQ